MPVSGSTGLPIGPRNKEWNGSDARRRVVDHYTSNGTTNWSQVKRAFFWIDEGKADQLTGYNLGFADIIDGQLKAMPRGLFAVAGGHGVQRIRIPNSAKTAIKRKVNTYYRKMKTAFPNDEFNFDPPFPEVKEEEEDMEEDVVKTVMEEITQKFFPLPMSATSFSDMASMEMVREAVQKVFKTVYSFQELASNVARQSESIPQLLTGLKSLTTEMAEIFDDMEFEDKEATENDKGLTKFIWDQHEENTSWEIKQGGSTALLKNEKGDQFFYGRFTNNLWDKDNEVLLTKAHEEFVNYLDSHMDEAPQLWDWHEEETAKEHRAVWVDFADGFLHAIWPVTETEAKGIEAFTEEFEPGMSHGFKVLERDNDDLNQIAMYRTFEASILPLEFAANEWTTFDLIKEQSKEEKMFSPEKQRALELLSLGKYRIPLGKASEEDAAKIDETGAQRKGSEQPADGTILNEKGKDTMSDPTDVPTTNAPTAAPEAAPTPPSTPPPADNTAIEALQASIVEGFQLITGRLEQIEEKVKAQGEALQGIKDTKGQSPSVAAWVAAQKAQSSVDATAVEGSSPGPEPKTEGDPDPLLGTGPEESPFEIQGHLLNGL